MSVSGVFLTHIFPHSDWIRKDTEYLSVFSLNTRKYGPEKLRIRTLSTQWKPPRFDKNKNKKKAWLCNIEDYIKRSFLNWRCIALLEECPNTGLFLVRIFPHLDWIRRDTKYLSVFSLIAGKYGPEITLYLDTFCAGLASATFCKHHRILAGKILSF